MSLSACGRACASRRGSSSRRHGIRKSWPGAGNFTPKAKPHSRLGRKPRSEFAGKSVQVKILTLAEHDLESGHAFYEGPASSRDWATTSSTRFTPISIRWRSMRVFTVSCSVRIVCLRELFPMRSTATSWELRLGSGRWWIAAANPRGLPVT